MAANKIGKIRIDFQIFDTGDPYMLLVGDFSDWKVIENMPAYIDITPPGKREPITLNFQKRSMQGFSSLSLGMSCPNCENNMQPLADGIYEFCLKGGAEGKRTKHKYFLKKDQLQQELDKAWIESGIEYDKNEKEKRDQLLYVEGYLRTAEAYARKGIIPECQDMFEMAKEELKNIGECKNCL